MLHNIYVMCCMSVKAPCGCILKRLVLLLIFKTIIPSSHTGRKKTTTAENIGLSTKIGPEYFCSLTVRGFEAWNDVQRFVFE